MKMRFLMSIFGRRIMLFYGGMAFVLVAVLSALFLNANYSIQSYINNQLGLIAWDASVSHQANASQYQQFQRRLLTIPGVNKLGTIALLRVRTRALDTQDVISAEDNGRNLSTAWFVVMAVSDQSILPPQLRSDETSQPGTYRAALIGGTRTDSRPELGGGSTLTLRQSQRELTPYDLDGDEKDTRPGIDTPQILLQSRVSSFVQIERAEMNRWLLRSAESISFFPEDSVVLVVPISELARISALLDKAFADTPDVDSVYLPEITHLVGLDRPHFMRPWRYADAIQNLSMLRQTLLHDVRDLTPSSTVGSNTLATLVRMESISRQVGIAALLLSIPLLWLGWLVSRMLSDLVLMNERRLIGLAIIRGISGASLGRALLLSLAAGGFAGGVLGLAAGLGSTIAVQAIAGNPPPPASLVLAGIGYLLLFVLIGTTLTIISGWGIVRRVRSMSPRDSIAHVSSPAVAPQSGPASAAYLLAVIPALLLGGYKIADWLCQNAFSIALRNSGAPYAGLLLALDTAMNFLVVPFVLFGLLGLQRRKARWLQYVLSGIAAPVAGKLQWFASSHLMVNRNRVISIIFVASLSMSLALLPQVAADTFNGRLVRGLEVSLGGDAQLDYNLLDLANTGSDMMASREIQRLAQPKLSMLARSVKASPLVDKVTLVEQFIDPEIYLRDQSGLTINLIQSADDYLQTVRYEDGLGISRPFSTIVRSAGNNGLVASSGLLSVRKLGPDRSINLGYEGDTPIRDHFGDVASFLPGQPLGDFQQREGYGAEQIDYLNHLASGSAWALSTVSEFQRGDLARLPIKPLRAVFILRLKPGTSDADVAALAGRLPIKPDNIRYLDTERLSLSKDMFISLTLSNMKVLLVGCLILSLSGIVAMGLVNLASERRTLSLLRVRGLAPQTVLRFSLAIFLAPVMTGVILGILLGVLAGYGISQTIWQMPRISGVAGLLLNKISFSLSAVELIVGFTLALVLVATVFSVWPLRTHAYQNLLRSR